MVSVPEMFDRISPHYDKTNRVLSFGMDLCWRRYLASHLPRIPGIRLLDLATGTGDQIAALFEKKAPIAKATGIDLSDGMLRIAKTKFQKRSYGNKTLFQKADAQKLPFAEGSFDLCTFSFGIRNVNDPHAALSEMYRVTTRGGRCLILEFSLPNNLFRFPYLFYLRHLLPHLGGWISKNKGAYRYLNRTIEAFAYGEAFIRWMRQSGWANATALPLALGSVTLYRGDKL